MRLHLLAATIATLLVPATAHNVATLEESPAVCTDGCVDALQRVSFGDVDPTLDYYDAMSSSNFFVSSLAACASRYCTDKQIRVGWDELSGYCLEYGTLPLRSWEDALALVPPSPKEVDTLAEAGTVFNETILVSANSHAAGLRTERTWVREMRMHHSFGWAMYVLFGLAITAGIFNRVFAFMARKTFIPLDHSQSPGFVSRFHTLWRKHIETPAFYGYKHSQTSWGFIQIPTRLQGLLVFLYVGINIIFTFVGYEIFYDNLYWYGENSTQLWRYVADRTGIMSFYNLPLLWLFASRNNIVLWVCGWSFDTLNLFHRHVSRVATVQAIIHSAAYTWLERDYLAEEFKEQYWWTGVIATITMSLMLGLSIKPIRERMYEVFLIGHIVLALVSLVALFYHVLIWEGEYNGWLWACTAIWASDRLLRIGRFLILTYTSVGKAGNAVVVASPELPDFMRVTVRTSSILKPHAGSFYYLYFLNNLTPWENHPFTLASWRKLESGQYQLEFLVAKQAGATKKLAKKVSRKGGQLETRCMVEGPYGHEAPVYQYGHILMIMGGSGITSALGYLTTLHGRSIQSTRTRYINLVWAVRTKEYSAGVLNAELAGLDVPEGMILSVDIYVTSDADVEGSAAVPALDMGGSPVEQAEGESPKTEEKVGFGATGSGRSSSERGNATPQKARESSIGDNSLQIRYHVGRPDLGAILPQAVLMARTGTLIQGQGEISGGKLAVLTCGPGAMMDDIRREVVKAYGNGKDGARGDELDLWEESFGW